MLFPPVGLIDLLKRLPGVITGRGLLTHVRRRSLWPSSVDIRVVDGGSCGDCEVEAANLSNPFYDLEHQGYEIVASPRHADVMLLTGPLVRSMLIAAVDTFRAMPEPRVVITVGDAFEESVFSGSYALAELPLEMEAAHRGHIPGDPPTPDQILDGIDLVMRRRLELGKGPESQTRRRL